MTTYIAKDKFNLGDYVHLVQAEIDDMLERPARRGNRIFAGRVVKFGPEPYQVQVRRTGLKKAEVWHMGYWNRESGMYLPKGRVVQSSPMANIQVQIPNSAIDTITPKAADGSTQPVASLTVSVDDYTTAYVAKYPAAGLNGFILVPKNSAQIGTKTVTVTETGTAVGGGALTPTKQSYDIVGAAPAPPANSLVLGPPTVGAFSGIPADPGSGTATLV